MEMLFLIPPERTARWWNSRVFHIFLIGKEKFNFFPNQEKVFFYAVIFPLKANFWGLKVSGQTFSVGEGGGEESRSLSPQYKSFFREINYRMKYRQRPLGAGLSLSLGGYRCYHLQLSLKI